MRFWVPLVVFGGVLGVLGVGLTLEPRVLPSPFIGKEAPGFEMPQLGVRGEEVTERGVFRSEGMRGKVWVMNVWASWCVGCRVEHEVLKRLAKVGGVPIVGLNYKDAGKDAMAWLKWLGNPYAYLPTDVQGDVGIEYGVYGVPETYLIDREGVIRFKHVGPLTWRRVEAILLPLVAGLQEGAG